MGLQTGKTLILALAGGAIFQLLHIPLAWLLGPMTILLVWREVFKKKAEWHRGFRNAGLCVLGYMMGITFNAEVAGQIAVQLPSMAAATLLTVAFGLVAGWITVKRTGISMASGLLGSIPGGLSQMAVLCDEVEDADMTVVTFMQTIRVMAVVFIVPFLAFHGLSSGGVEGAASTAAVASAAASVSWMSSNTIWFVLAVAVMLVLGPKLHLPTPYMLGPMLGAALLSVAGLEAPALPHWSVLTAQVLVGAHMGVTTSLSSLDNWKKLLPYALFGAIGIVLFSLGTGYLLTLWHPMSLLTAFLGSAPGGMTEMGVTGAALGADLSIIVAYQMFRLLFILFIAPYIVKGLLRLYRARTDSPEKGY